MRKLAKSTVLGLVMLSVLVVNAPAANAQVTREKARCASVISKIALTLSKFQARKNLAEDHRNRMEEKLRIIIDKAKAEGYDVTKLATDTDVLVDKANKTSADYDTLISKLQAIGQYDCASSSVEGVKQALRDAKAQVKVLRSDLMDMRDYFRTVIKADVEDIKAQARADKETTQ